MTTDTWTIKLVCTVSAECGTTELVATVTHFGSGIYEGVLLTSLGDRGTYKIVWSMSNNYTTLASAQNLFSESETLVLQDPTSYPKTAIVTTEPSGSLTLG